MCFLCRNNPKADGQSKALRVADILVDKLASGFITCRQMAIFAQRFPQGAQWIYDHAHVAPAKPESGAAPSTAPASISASASAPPTAAGSSRKPFHHFGTYRTEVILSLLSHIVDVGNFDVRELAFCAGFYLSYNRELTLMLLAGASSSPAL